MLFSCSVWSPKGGCGKSTIALTLASFFAAEDTSRRVLLVDADASRTSKSARRPTRRPWHAGSRSTVRTSPESVV